MKKHHRVLSLALSAALALAACGGGDDSPAPAPAGTAPAPVTETPPVVSGGGDPPSPTAETDLQIALKLPQPWTYKPLAADVRADLLIQAMTLAQKQQQLVGSGATVVAELPECYGSRHVNGIPDLKIPTLRITNGPVGIGQNDCIPVGSSGSALFNINSAKATALPSAMAIAASFDTGVATKFGDVIGTEANNLALHVFEAPGVNMARLPVLGRNFEYFGEDPFLSGAMAVAETKAVQSKGVIAMAKHFAANEQEVNRNSMNAVIDDQVLHEIYLLPFEMAVKDGQIASMMCSYNSLNGYQTCESRDLLTGILRNQWGFKGYVQTDFNAAKSTAPTMLAGTDHEMFSGNRWSVANLNTALTNGDLKVSDLELALKRRYTQMFKLGIMDRPVVRTPVDFAAGGAKALEIGHESSVLLQNNGALPYPNTVRKVIVVGKATQVYAQQAVAGGARVGIAMGAGGGSSDVVANYTVTPVQGIQNALASLGVTTATVKLALVDDSNTTGTVDGVVTPYAAILAEAAASDAVVVMAGTIAEEGADRATFGESQGNTLVGTGDNLDWYASSSTGISTSAGSNPTKNSNSVQMIKDVLNTTSTTAKAMKAKMTLVLKDNAGVAMDPALVGANGPAILEAWFPGQEDGNIVANILFGRVNPSAKLPVTFPVVGSTFMGSVTASMYPGVRVGNVPTVTYEEKLAMGYRWYQARNVTPAFAFGHGLSFTTFNLNNLSMTSPTADNKFTVKVQVANNGAMDGSEVVQVYLGVPSGGYAAQPPKRLVAFQKVAVPKATSKDIEITIDNATTNHPLSVWDKAAQQFVIPRGTFTVYVGNSSANLTTVGTFTR